MSRKRYIILFIIIVLIFIGILNFYIQNYSNSKNNDIYREPSYFRKIADLITSRIDAWENKVKSYNESLSMLFIEVVIREDYYRINRSYVKIEVIYDPYTSIRCVSCFKKLLKEDITFSYDIWKGGSRVNASKLKYFNYTVIESGDRLLASIRAPFLLEDVEPPRYLNVLFYMDNDTVIHVSPYWLNYCEIIEKRYMFYGFKHEKDKRIPVISGIPAIMGDCCRKLPIADNFLFISDEWIKNNRTDIAIGIVVITLKNNLERLIKELSSSMFLSHIIKELVFNNNPLGGTPFIDELVNMVLKPYKEEYVFLGNHYDAGTVNKCKKLASEKQQICIIENAYDGFHDKPLMKYRDEFIVIYGLPNTISYQFVNEIWNITEIVFRYKGLSLRYDLPEFFYATITGNLTSIFNEVGADTVK